MQTHRDDLAMSTCKRNCERKGVATIEHRRADWAVWEDSTRYGWIVRSDILYGAEMQL